MFHLIYHGGYCCGIMHIYGFSSSPEKDCFGTETLTLPSPNYESKVPEYCLNAARFSQIEREHNIRSFCLPKTTKEFKGLKTKKDLFIAALNETREYAASHGLIEIVLTGFQNAVWKAAVVEQGFEEVNYFVNSNSGSMLTVYHKLT